MLKIKRKLDLSDIGLLDQLATMIIDLGEDGRDKEELIFILGKRVVDRMRTLMGINLFLNSEFTPREALSPMIWGISIVASPNSKVKPCEVILLNWKKVK